jgi:hypothetical protein
MFQDTSRYGVKTMGMTVTDIEKMAHDLSVQVTSLTHQYGPQAWSVICGIKRIDSIGYLAAGLLCIICAGVGVKMLQYVHAHWREWDWDDAGITVLSGFSGCGLLALFATGVAMLVNIWNWVGAFDPGLAIAHDVMQKALSSGCSRC